MLGKMIRNVRASIRKKLFFSYFVVVSIPLLLIGSILYVSMLSITEQQTLDNRATQMKLVSQQLQAYVDQLELYSRVIYTGEVQQLLNEGPPEEPIALTRWKSALFEQFEQWYGYMNIKATIQNVTIVFPDGTMISKEPLYGAGLSFRNAAWYREAVARQGEVVIAGPFLRPFADPGTAQSPHTFSLVRKINNTLSPADLGGIVIDINVMDIARLLSTLQLNQISILNAEGKLVYSQRAEEIGEVWPYDAQMPNGMSGWLQIDGERMLVNAGELPATGWRFVSLDPLGSLSAYAVTVRNITLGVGLFALLIALVISTFIAGRITKPLRTLQANMKQVQTGRFDTRLQVNRSDEVGQLTQSFNQMTDRIESLVNDVYKSEIIRKEAQLKALHSQINPHFLYNTLDSMNALAILENVPLLARMSKMLADMFRYSISQGEHVVALRDELNQVKRYIEIQQIRYDHKFRLFLSIPEKLLDYPIPKLALQPIVENAVYHGLEMIPDEGIIAITAYETADLTMIEVFDNGKGMTEAQLNEISAHLSAPIDYTEHLGLANVQERLQLYFGGEYGISIHSIPEKGTNVVYRLPAHTIN
ncbi:cache domain-containing sensor histidine kinase [Paenibacillus tyrfis]|uniref:cache domain-containing sensor histidine kinase n=1 Tax=Paenibacillus tyrfis TaxID=1501230 RepID=UPI00209E8B61|nr:sensor histidine kinase [Paenibacillus tyrfis]MCP1305636.1 sensor histidine kinase [Paenibacillus tyrfis]